MTHRRPFAPVALLLAFWSGGLPAAAQPIREIDGGPAFLDAPDRVVVWLDAAARPETLGRRIRVEFDGRPWPVAEVVPGERARPPIPADGFVVAGTIQRALGGAEWDPAGWRTLMRAGAGGARELVVALPQGRWEYKIAQGGDWGRNWGRDGAPAGPNVVLDVPRDGTVVRIVFDPTGPSLRDSLNHPGEVTAPATAPAPPSDDPVAGRVDSVALRLARPIPLDRVHRPLRVRVEAENRWRTVFARSVLDDPRFFHGEPNLGATWTPQRTTFRVWSPVAERAELRLFRRADGPAHRTLPLRRGANGVWTAEVSGDLHGVFYQYGFRSYGRNRTAADIWGRAASADSARSMVVDLSRTNPEGWPVPRPFSGRVTDAVVYEAHIRDLTVDPSSGVRPEWRGKYLGLAERGTRVPGTTFPTGLDYLVDLGVTHLHLLPWQNFNPAHSEQYNWGYETTLFDVPEEQYSTDRHDPVRTIRESKAMIAALQRAGIGAVLDVVYNHTVPSEGELSAFWETVPYYWFRTNDRGDVLNESGVGNALHDERPMVRRYVRDSLLFWLREYRMDGFRFDLLGMFAPDTVRDLATALRREMPNVLLYGEPWTGGGPLRFGKGDQRGMGMAVFNDRFRGAFRGDLDGDNAGFMTGGGDADAVRRAAAGSIEFDDRIRDFAAGPDETLNYVSAHDNLTLRDRIARTLSDPAGQRAALRFAHAAVLLSQGIPFLEGGPMIGRTKGGNHNSYNAGDEVNRYDWSAAPAFADVHAYVRALIALRRAQPAFRLPDADTIRQRMRFLPAADLPEGVVAWTLDGRGLGGWNEVLVILHGRQTTASMNLPAGEWNLAVDGDEAGVQGRRAEGRLTLDPLSATVLWR